MVQVFLWLTITWKNITDKFISAVKMFVSLRTRILCMLLARCDYQHIVAFARILHFCFPARRQDKLLQHVANENRRCLLGEPGTRIDYIWINKRRRILELAATWGANRALRDQLATCTQALNAIVGPLHDAGCPVVLAPLHMVSDVLAGIVGSNVYPGEATIIVSSSAQQFPPGNGIPITYCSIHDNEHQIASNLLMSLEQAVEHKRNIMLFPDITPDFTHQANISGSAKAKHVLFNRTAHLHNGIVRISRMMAAQVVFFYLYYDKGIKIFIYPPVSYREVNQKLPVIIEQSIVNHPDEWLLWHTHSLFFFNEC